MVESWYETGVGKSGKGSSESMLLDTLVQYFEPLTPMLIQNPPDAGRIKELGEELADYCQGDPEVLEQAQRYLFALLTEQEEISHPLIVDAISWVGAGFTHKSQDLIFERYHLLIDNYHHSQQQLLREKSLLALINNIGNKIAAVLDLDELFMRTAELAQSSFGFKQVAIFVVQDDQALLKAAAGELSPLLKKAETHSLAEGVIGWVARNGRDYLTNHMADGAADAVLQDDSGFQEGQSASDSAGVRGVCRAVPGV